MYLTGVVFVVLCSKIFGFNIDTNHFIVYVDPQRGENYFGYSVLLSPGGENGEQKWAKIGAPKGQDPSIRAKNPGVVYNCPLIEPCKPINLKKGVINKGEIIDDAWIGGSMDISDKFQRIVICGFRTKNDLKIAYDLIGSCYFSYLNDSFTEANPLRRELRIKGGVYFYAQGQAGFSTHFPKDENAVLLGAPGVNNWAGTIVKYKDTEYEDPVASRLRSSRNRRNLVREKSIGIIAGTYINYAFDLFGYAISSGYFYGPNKLYYVTSTPKDFSCKGKVTVFEFKEKNSLKAKTSMVGDQFGEYFGASITAGDLNRDGYDDLIVGAPFHAQETFNEGAVYVFVGRQGRPKLQQTLYGKQINGQFGSALMFLGDINKDQYGDVAIGAPYEEEFSGVLYIYRGNTEGINPQPCQRIVGRHITPYIKGFGISISRPADIDGNGYQDLLVGAYKSGNAVLLRTRPIVAVYYQIESIPKELKQDIEHFVLNVCYWYTYYKGTIDLNRTLVIDHQLNRTVLGNAKDVNKIVHLDGRTCENITVSLKDGIIRDLPITVSLSYNLRGSQKQKEVMYISDKHLNGTNTFCATCPILDQYRSSQPSLKTIPFSLGCGLDNICQAKLTLDAKFSKLGANNEYVVGTEEYLDLNILIKNSGEHAYSTQLEITLPDIITFRQIPSNCSDQNTLVIICTVNNLYPLRTNEERRLTLSLDMKRVNKDSYHTQLSVELRVTTTSHNSNPNKKSPTMRLKREADITISGKSGQQSVPFGNKTHVSDFTHTYQVEKIGVSPLERVRVNISVPHYMKTPTGNVALVGFYPTKATLAGQPVMCTSDIKYLEEAKTTEVGEKVDDDIAPRKKRQIEVFKAVTGEKKENIVLGGKKYDLDPKKTYFLNCSKEDIVCSSIICTMGPLEKGQVPPTIEIKMTLNTSGITGLLGEKKLILYSTSGTVTVESPEKFVQSGNRSDSAEVSTLLIDENLKKKTIALWIIILAAIIGILLLALIIYGLTKAGFFKREKKEELKNLKAATQGLIEAEACPEDLDPPITNSSTEGLVEEDQIVEE